LLFLSLAPAMGNQYLAAITSIDIETWLAKRKQARFVQRSTEMKRQMAADKQGRLYITLHYPPGRPVLSKYQFEAMLASHFQGYTEPKQVEIRDSRGLKIEGTGNLTWCAYVSPMDKWPARLSLPELGDRCYYLFLLQSECCKQNKLCQWCHQPSCKARHYSSCQEYRLAYRQRPDRMISRPSRGYTTLNQATQSDPMAHHYYTTNTMPRRY
jgi:hypothetical protein